MPLSIQSRGGLHFDMSGHTKIILKNSLREHHKPNFINTIRKLINVRKGSSVGSDVIIDKNVEILRFPKMYLSEMK